MAEEEDGLAEDLKSDDSNEEDDDEIVRSCIFLVHGIMTYQP
jgi:hypothetical protein